MKPFFARAQVRHESGQMNKTEALYAEILELRRLAGEILEWAYEPEKLRLADNTYLTPDFRVILRDGTVEFHETKGGFIREDSWIKLKIAAETHPYRFFVCQMGNKKVSRGEWKITEI